jgi:hypothetical protein
MSGLLLALIATALAAEPVVIEVEPGDQPAVRVKAAAGEVAVPACRGVVWERFDAATDRYVPVPADPCGPLSNALFLDKEGIRFDLSLDVDSAQVVRAVVVVGTGCAKERPFPLGRCASVVAVEGPTLTVRPRTQP